MTRLSLIASLALIFSGVAFAAPQEVFGISDPHAETYRDFWPCGTRLPYPGPNRQTDDIITGAGTHIIDNVFINPDRPEAGKQVTITVNARAPSKIEVSRSSDRDMWSWLIVGSEGFKVRYRLQGPREDLSGRTRHRYV